MSDRSRKGVLLVDDDADVAWAVGRILTREGYQVTTCTDGQEAMGLLDTQSFSALVTDLQMPRCNGLELLDWAREHRPRTRVVVMTAFGSAAIRELCMQRGAVHYLEKPVDPKLLVEILQATERHDTFSGSIAGIDLLDYVQLILVTRRQVVVDVTSVAGERGRLYLSEGFIPHAACEGLSGQEALFRCLGFDGGTFTTRRWEEPPVVTMAEPGEFLLMEAARTKDEAARDRGLAAPDGADAGDLDFDLSFDSEPAVPHQKEPTP